MEKRALIAVGLSILIIVFYPYLLGKLYPKPESPRSEAPQELGEIGYETSPNTTAVAPPQPLAIDPMPIEDTVFESDVYHIMLTNKGGCIKSITLKDYKKTGTDELVELIEFKSPNEAPFSIDGIDPQINLSEVIYQTEANEEGVVYTYRVPNKFELTKKFIFYKSNYSMDLYLNVVNLGDVAKEIGYVIVGGSRIDKGMQMDRRFLEASSMVNGRLQRATIRSVKNHEVSHAGEVSWLALKNRYFSLILKSFQPTSRGVVRLLSDDNLLMGIEIAPVTVQPNQTLTHHFLLYAGPNDLDRLTSYNFGFDQTIDFGIFGGLSKLLLSALRFFYGFVHNWGVSIVVVTILISFILYPLTKKSFTSMNAMQTMQPQIEKLRQTYKDNPQKLNREIMALYRHHRINPLGGCFPMFLQMPIFFAFYRTLARSIELKGARFLWVKDLSAPDEVCRLPFSLPVLGNSLNILPLLMVVSMVVQQKFIQPAGAVAKNQQQKTMMALMPVMFGVILYNMPSGLVLYWLTNTILMIVYQLRMKKATGI